MAQSGVLRIRVVRVSTPPPISKNFEEWLLQQQEVGKHLLTYEFDDGVFTVHLGEVGTMEHTSETWNGQLNIRVGPWRIPIFTSARTILRLNAGDLVCIPRIVDTYADVLAIGDPVELADISSGKTLLSGEVTWLVKARVRDVRPGEIQWAIPRVQSVSELIAWLEREYESPVLPDAVISLVFLRIVA